MLHFAYGSNLDAEDFAAFCARHGFGAARLDPRGPALLLDHSLAFDRHSAGRGGGVLNLAADPAQAVAGVLFEANPAAIAALDAKEGHPHAYARREVHVVRPDGSLALAVTYQGPGQGHHAPHPDYLAVVRRGQARHGLDHAMLEAAAADRPAPLTVAWLFVYGTLMAGEANAHHLAGAPRSAAEVTARLHDCGPYPAVRLGAGRVRGELVAWTRDRQPALDALEGSAPAGSPEGTYRRAVLTADTAAGPCPAYIYLMDDADRFPVIPGGDWRAKPGRQALWAAHAARAAPGEA